MPVNCPPIVGGPVAVGDFAPWFTLPSDARSEFQFSTLAGRRTLLFFLGTDRAPQVAAALAGLARRACDILRDLGILAVGISVERRSEREVAAPPPCRMRMLYDLDRSVSRRYGLCADGAGYLPTALLLDENLRVAAILPVRDPARFGDEVRAAAALLAPVEPARPAAPQAPVLMVRDVLGQDLCALLIRHHEDRGGQPSGFMDEADGMTHGVIDRSFKRRRDVRLLEPALLRAVNLGILKRVVPEVFKSFQFTITRFERHLIACYDGEDGGLFRPHRDNTTRGTAHRRFAMSLNLNAGAYEGGQIRFPEYGNALFSPRTGEAMLFSCLLQHEALSVRRGRRFALLSFFYDETARELRKANMRFIAEGETSAASDAPTPQPADQAVS